MLLNDVSSLGIRLSVTELHDSVVNIIIIYRKQCLNEVILIQILTTRVYTLKDICNIFFISLLPDFQNRQGIVLQVEKRIQILFNGYFLIIG